MAAVCLHNFIITRNLEIDDENNFYKNNRRSHQFNDNVSSSESESESESDSDPEDDEEPDAEAEQVRALLKNYFISAAGYVKWQWKKLT